MGQVRGMIGSMLVLIGLYLVLRNGANAGKVIGATATGVTRVFKTLQGR